MSTAPGVLITFDFDHPASKLSPLPGVVFFFGDGLYVTGFEFDSSHGFTNCVALRQSIGEHNRALSTEGFDKDGSVGCS